MRYLLLLLILAPIVLSCTPVNAASPLPQRIVDLAHQCGTAHPHQLVYTSGALRIEVPASKIVDERTPFVVYWRGEAVAWRDSNGTVLSGGAWRGRVNSEYHKLPLCG